MTREHAQQEREAFNAFCDGKPIQEKSINPSTGRETGWVDTPEPQWGTLCEHRIKPAPRMVPLGPEDVPLDSWFQQEPQNSTMRQALIGIDSDGITLGCRAQSMERSFERLQKDNWLISRDGGRTWQRAEKEEKV